LSLRTHAQGASQYYTKTFEYTLSVNAEENVELPGVTFAYFDPRLETYQSMTTPAITLVHRPAPAGGDTAGQSLGDESPLRQWSSRPAVVSLPALKIFHAL